MKRIRDFIDTLDFSSSEELLKKSQYLADGAGLLSCESNPLWNVLSELPPHAEYDFDVSHFQATVSEREIPQITQALVTRNQFVAFAFSKPESNWIAEQGFVQSRGHGRAPPLILHFTNTLENTALEFQQRLQKNAEIVHVGLQFHCTTREGIDQTIASGMKIAPLKEIERVGLLRCLESTSQLGFQQSTWIRLDLNCLAASEGGRWATGLQIREILPLFEWLMRQTKLQGVSIGPVASGADTLVTRTAAQLIATLLFAYSHRQIVSSAHGKKASEIFS